MELADDERWLDPLPLSHVGGLMVVLRSALMATTAVLGAARAASPRPGSRSRRSSRPSCSGCSTPARSPGRTCGGSCSAAARCRARCSSAPGRPGFPVCPSYGLTQACSTVTVAEPGDLETAGRALPGVGVAVSEDGEIIVSGATVNALGGVRTGDLGRLDERGRLVVTGRKGDVIITRRRERRARRGRGRAGRAPRAWPRRPSSPARTRSGARRSPRWSSPRDGAEPDAAALRLHCLERLAPFKVPKAFELVGELPRTASGKVRRADLR